MSKVVAENGHRDHNVVLRLADPEEADVLWCNDCNQWVD
jgi:hypothetical protein